MSEKKGLDATCDHAPRDLALIGTLSFTLVCSVVAKTRKMERTEMRS